MKISHNTVSLNGRFKLKYKTVVWPSQVFLRYFLKDFYGLFLSWEKGQLVMRDLGGDYASSYATGA